MNPNNTVLKRYTTSSLSGSRGDASHKNEYSSCLLYQGGRVERPFPDQWRSQLGEIESEGECHTYQSKAKVQLEDNH